MSNVYLHPVTALDRAAVAALERRVGLVAVVTGRRVALVSVRTAQRLWRRRQLALHPIR